MSRFVVYCHTNKENGKKYVGITSQNPEKRWRNGEGYKNNEYFYRAIQKYGWHNFTHEILYTGLSVSAAEVKEKELIKEYGCYMPENGYNIQLGGNSGVKFTQESKRKISLALSGKPKSDEHKIHLGVARTGHAVDESTRRKLKERNSGEGNPMWGRKRDISCYPAILSTAGYTKLSAFLYHFISQGSAFMNFSRVASMPQWRTCRGPGCWRGRSPL